MKDNNKIIAAMHEVNSLRSEGYQMLAAYYDRHDAFYMVTMRHANGNRLKVRATPYCGNVTKNGVVVKTF